MANSSFAHKPSVLSAADDDPLGVTSSSYPRRTSTPAYMGLSRTPPTTSISPLAFSLPLTRGRPHSFGGSADHGLHSPSTSTCSLSSGGTPATGTLVRPRSWRIVPKSRAPGSAEREKKAVQEDTTLEGDPIDPLREYEMRCSGYSSSLEEDGDSSFREDGEERVALRANSQEDRGAEDPQYRARSASDAAQRAQRARKAASTGTPIIPPVDPQKVFFKTRPDRFRSLRREEENVEARLDRNSRRKTLPGRFQTLAHMSQSMTLDQPSAESESGSPVLTKEVSKSQTLPIEPKVMALPLEPRAFTIHLSSSKTRKAERRSISHKAEPEPPLSSMAETTSHSAPSLARSLTLPMDHRFKTLPAESKPHIVLPERKSLTLTADTKPPMSTLEPGPAQPIQFKPERSRSGSRTPEGMQKTVTFSEPNTVIEFDPPSSPEKSCDSPSRTLTLNMKDSVAYVSFPKSPPPPVATKPVTPEKPLQVVYPSMTQDKDKPMTARQDSLPEKERPPVPTKPARLSLVHRESSSLEEAGRMVSPTCPQAASQPPLSTYRASSPTSAGLEKPKRLSSLVSPKSPVDDILFSQGFFVVGGEGERRSMSPKPPPPPVAAKPKLPFTPTTGGIVARSATDSGSPNDRNLKSESTLIAQPTTIHPLMEDLPTHSSSLLVVKPETHKDTAQPSREEPSRSSMKKILAKDVVQPPTVFSFTQPETPKEQFSRQDTSRVSTRKTIVQDLPPSEGSIFPNKPDNKKEETQFTREISVRSSTRKPIIQQDAPPILTTFVGEKLVTASVDENHFRRGEATRSSTTKIAFSEEEVSAEAKSATPATEPPRVLTIHNNNNSVNINNNSIDGPANNSRIPMHEVEIVPKRMMKIKGDKKAEEKAAKALKKEQKAREKELKALKKKAEKEKEKEREKAASDPDPEKGRVKVFPWKVEFSPKDKAAPGHAVDKQKEEKEKSKKKKKEKDKDKEKSKEKKKRGKQDEQDLDISAPVLVHATRRAGEPSSGIYFEKGANVFGQASGTSQDDEAGPKKDKESADGASSSIPAPSSQQPDSESSTPTEDREDRPALSTFHSPAPAHPLQQQTEHVKQKDPKPEEQEEKKEEAGQQGLPQPQQQSPTLGAQSDSPMQPLQRSPEHIQNLGSDSPEQQQQQQLQQQQQQHQQQQQQQKQQPQPQQQQDDQQQASLRHPYGLPPPKPPKGQRVQLQENVEQVASFSEPSSLESAQRPYASVRRGAGRERPALGSLSDSEGSRAGGSPEDEENGISAKKPLPRRHTVGGAQIRENIQLLEETEKKREAFYELLANRYPQYAEKITGLTAGQTVSDTERNPRSREPQRRRTTAVTYTPQGRFFDGEDQGTMSDIELSSFQRGGYARASMPVARSASTSLERPIGLVFLIYRDETKKALLPNEITSLDTVRALFVRAFPEKLTMEILDSPRNKIYILEATTSIFFQLEDLRDIQDRTVLKIHECDSDEPQRVKCPPEIRGRTVQRVSSASRPASRQGENGSHYEVAAKSHSLPVASAQVYQEMMQKERAQFELEQDLLHGRPTSRSRSQTPEPAERPRSLSATGAARGRYSHSPERMMSTPGAMHNLNPIPENPRLLANGFREAAMNGGGHYETLPGPPGHGHFPPHGRGLSPGAVVPPIYESMYQTVGYNNQQAYVSHSTRAPLPQGPQRATGPHPAQFPDMRGITRGAPGRNSLPFAAMSNPIYDSVPQRSQSYRNTPERDVLPPRPQSATPRDMSRMERMEAQIASLAAWVHQAHTSPPSEPVRRTGPGSSRSTSSTDGTDGTYPGSSASSMSDIPTSYSLRKASLTADMREKMNDVQCRLHELRVELQGLRRMEQLNQETMREAFADSMVKLKKVIGSVPGAEHQLLRHQRVEADTLAAAYLQDKTRVEQDLGDLEKNVEELKTDVIARKCLISVSDVEMLALMLSTITKTLADLKARFPHVHECLKRVMAAEMEIVVQEEKFVKEEPRKIEAALKRCKNLTSTLYTLKRLAEVQDKRPVQIPQIESREVREHEKMAVLESIRAMVPDHESRLQSIEVATKALKHQDLGGASTECADGKRNVDGTSVPSKPARHLTNSELKRDKEDADAIPTASHTVTVTSQISSDGRDGSCRDSARLAFFSSLQSTSSSSSSSSSCPISVATSVPVTSIPAPSHSRPVTSAYGQGLSPTKSRSAFSSIPLPSRTVSDSEAASGDKGKRVPPPPPPRKSSARYGPLSPSSVNGVGYEGVARRRSSSGSSGEKSPDYRKKESGLAVFSPASSQAATSGVPLSASTPKQPTSQQKPMTKYQKELAAGIYANLNRPDLQNQRLAPDRLLSSMASPPPAAVSTNSQDPQDEVDNMSDSTGSSTSLDSQLGAASLRSPLGLRGPRPDPPQRHSSLGPGKGTPDEALCIDAGQKPNSASALTNINGSTSQNGHNT